MDLPIKTLGNFQEIYFVVLMLPPISSQSMREAPVLPSRDAPVSSTTFPSGCRGSQPGTHEAFFFVCFAAEEATAISRSQVMTARR